MKKIITTLIVVGVIGFGIYAVNSPSFLENSLFKRSLTKIEIGLNDELTKLVEESGKRLTFLASPPLTAKSDSPQSFLTNLGVKTKTNEERTKEGLPVLVENTKLNAVAAAKVDDMFAKQYFEHVSPSGISAGDIAEEKDYDFIAIGENLALGNYRDDADLVKAWMESPGHRANILNNKFQEIGIAVKKGMYKGRMTWFAVQEFGKPLSSCPSPAIGLSATIKDYEAQINALKDLAEAQRNDLENRKPRTRAEQTEYNEDVRAYNELAAEINALINTLKSVVANYNEEVRKFNDCVDA